MRSYSLFAAVVAGLLASPTLIMSPAQAGPAVEEKDWSPTLLSTEPLYDGSAVRLRYTDGITIVASAGAEVRFVGSETPVEVTADGRRIYERAVQVVESFSPDRFSASDAAAYEAAGRSVYADALAAGFSPAEARQQAPLQGTGVQDEPPIWRSSCLRSEDSSPDPDFEWSGCWKLYDVVESDPDAWYFAASATAHGWGTSWFTGKELERGYSNFIWDGPGMEIIEASPPANLAGMDCGSYTVGLEFIVSLSYPVPLCNDGWDVTWNQANHKVEWHGASAGGESDTRAASGANLLRVPASTTTFTLSYDIGWVYHCLLC